MYRQRIQQLAREAGFPVEDYGDNHFILTQEMVGQLRLLSYAEQWRLVVSNRWYHIKMHDQSVFVFSEGERPSYSFLHCPLESVTFSEYLAGLGVDDIPRNRKEHLANYEMVLDTLKERGYVTPIRFDYDPGGYVAGVHPVAHIHVGMDNDIRLFSNKMSAKSFVLFVMRHMYPSCWQRLLTRDSRGAHISSIRDVATRIPGEYFGDLDRIELHLA